MAVSLALQLSPDVKSEGMTAPPDYSQEYHLLEFTQEIAVGHGLSVHIVIYSITI